MQRDHFGDDQHGTREDTTSSNSSDRSTKDKDNHTRRCATHYRSSFEDRDCKEYHSFRWEDLLPLGVHQVETEQREEEGLDG